MEELLVQLITKARTEAEEAHRQHIAALNGLAGIAIIQVSITTTCDICLVFVLNNKYLCCVGELGGGGGYLPRGSPLCR